MSSLCTFVKTVLRIFDIIIDYSSFVIQYS
jgi:hypothetical protein